MAAGAGRNEEQVAALSPDDVDVLAARLDACRSSLMADCIAVVQEVMARELWRADGCLTAAGWVAERFRVSGREARQWCRTAARLVELDAISAALADGRLSWDQAVPVVEMCEKPSDQEWWLGIGVGATVEHLEGLARRQRAAQRERERERRRGEGEVPRNRLRLRVAPEDDSVRGWLEMHGDDGLRLLTAIEHLAKNELAPLPGESRDPWDVRCGDALAMLASATLGGISRDRATINVHLDAEAAATNAEAGEASMGAPWDFRVAPSVLERLYCDGRCRIVLDTVRAGGGLDAVADASGWSGPAAWSAAEHPPPALEQAVLRRDAHCVVRGCRSRHGEIHHIVWRSRGGPTTLSNLSFVCWRHHRMIHDHGWQLTGTAEALTWSRPDGTVVWSTGPPRMAA